MQVQTNSSQKRMWTHSNGKMSTLQVATAFGLVLIVFASNCSPVKVGTPLQSHGEASSTDENRAVTFMKQRKLDSKQVTSETRKARLFNSSTKRRAGSCPWYMDVCLCYDVTVDCSFTHGKLTYIPNIQSKYKRLFFSNNNLSAIQSREFFKNASGIEFLNLESNGLRRVCSDAFYYMTNLTSLTLSYNLLDSEELFSIVFPISMKWLALEGMNLGPPPENFLKEMPNLTALLFAFNAIFHLNFSTFKPLTQLRYLDVANSHINRVTSARMPNLQTLYLDNNDIFQWPNSCSGAGSLYPSLVHLNISNNRLTEVSATVCFPMLSELNLSENPIVVFKNDSFGNSKLPSLKLLHLNYLQFRANLGVEKFAFRNPNLKYFSMTFSVLSSLDPDCFSGCFQLATLELTRTMVVGSLEDSEVARLFRPLKQLNTLYLADAGMRMITRDTFSGLSSLEILVLCGNNLQNLPDGAFDALPNLSYLDLSGNQLTIITESTFKSVTRNRLWGLHLSRNPFECNCDLRWFQRWFVSSPLLFNDKGAYFYRCNNLAGLYLRDFSIPDQSCLLKETTSKVIVACMMLCILLIVAISLVYHHRWHIRLRLAFRGQGQLLQQHLAGNEFKYDVFISSAEEDETWVLKHLLPYVEDQLRLRTCFHQRDFRPGKNILNNIVDSVKDSKKFLMVFSPHFARSQWCQFELDLCLGHVIDYDDSLLVVVMSDMTSRHVTSTMTAVLKTTTYIQWPECPDVRASFWRRMKLALRDITVGAHVQP